MATHKLTYAVQGSGISLTKDISNTQAGVSLIDGETVDTAETDYELDFNLDVSLCKSFYLVSNQDVTFDTNVDAPNPGVDGDVIALRADEPYTWQANSYEAAFLLTVDVINVRITNVSGETATIYCIALFDAVIP